VTFQARAGKAAVAAALLALQPVAAQAHAFTAGADLYRQFVEGSTVPLVTAPILMLLLPLGLLAGLWRQNGMVLIWPGFALGLLAGIPAAPLASPGIALAASGVGIVLAVLAALAVPLTLWPARGLATLAGLTASMVSLEGHGWGELPVLIHLGILFGAHLVVMVPAALVASSLDHWNDRPWLRIGWRILASWSAAISVLLLAFALA
jgi:hypothetical protein